MNSVQLIGRLGKNPEIRYLESGMCIAEFSIALDRVSRGEKTTDWVDVTAFEKTAEVIANYVTKGSQVGITGRLQQDKWVDRESGGNRSKLKVVCDRLDLLGGKREGEASDSADEDFNPGFNVAPQAEPVKAKSKPKAAAAKSTTPAPEVNYEDIPF